MLSSGMIFLDICIGVLGLIMALGFIAANDSRRKRFKVMKARTIGMVVTTESTYQMNTNWRRDDTPSMKRHEERTARYTFNIDGIEYHGVGECSLFKFSGSTVKIYYNPDNPNENCTVYEKRWQTGNGEALVTLIIVGIIILVPILLSMLINILVR